MTKSPKESFYKKLNSLRQKSKHEDEPIIIHFKHVHSNNNAYLKEMAASSQRSQDFFKTNDNAHLGSTSKQISKKLGEDNDFSDEEKKAITAYSGHHDGDDPKDRTSWHSYQINNALARGKKVPKRHEGTVAGLDSAIANNPIRHKVSTYSGVSFDPRTKLDKKGRMKSSAFISSTHDKKVSRGFSYGGHTSFRPTHTIQFHLRPGDPATHISQHSHLGGEHETVIGRNATLEHMHTDSHWDPDNEHWTHIHHMRIVRD